MAWASRLIRRNRDPIVEGESGPLADLHAWVLGLPWVVERPAPRSPAGVRFFAVDCVPLDRRQMWLTTGPLHSGDAYDRARVSIVLPAELCAYAETAGWSAVSPALPAGHVLVTRNHAMYPEAKAHLEAMLLAAYMYALS